MFWVVLDCNIGPDFLQSLEEVFMPLSQRGLDRAFALIIALLLVYFFIIVQVRITWTDYWLTKDEQRGVAVITKVLWTGHNGVAYQYRVNQKEYGGEDAVDSAKNLGYLGESVIVYFSYSHPWLSRLRLPRSAMPEGLPAILLAWFFYDPVHHHGRKPR